MSRGTTLTALIAMCRQEAGHSDSVAAGVDNESSIIRKIQRTQEQLYDDYDWPFLRNDWSINLQSGQRFYDFPTEAGFPGNIALNFERIEQTWIDYSGRPVPIDKGIGQPQYAQYNSNAATPETASPARRWDIKRSSDSKEQIEIWPIPSDNTQIFWIRGIKKLRPLIAPSDVADLDDIMLSLFVAAELTARDKEADSKLIQSAAQSRIKTLKGRVRGASRMRNLTGSTADTNNRNRGKTIIRIGSQTN